MGLLWTVVLVVFGCISGFDHVNALHWCLVGVFLCQDAYDAKNKGRR